MHTPAPWRIGFSDSSGINEGIYITTESDGVVVRGGSPEGDLMFGVLRVEDARLIAAAPELLSVAIKAEALISGELVGVEWKRACAEFVKEARAAIARATGGQ
jgi:hypothetical protein